MRCANSPFIGKTSLVKKPIRLQQDGYNRRRKRLRKRTVLIGVWNIQGLQNKVGEVIKEMEARNQDIIILSETKKKGRGIERIGSYTHFYSGVPKNQRAKRGISILMKNKFKRMVTNWEPIDENLIKINIDIHGYKITIIGVYGISEDEPICKKDDFYNNLNGIIEDIGKTREIIIAGDFNSRTGSKIGNKIIGPFGENVTNDNGNRLIDICEQNSLKILNGFYQHKEIHKYTWHKDTFNQKSIIDYIIIKQQTRIKIHDIRVYRGVTLNDHYLVNSKFLFPFRGKSTEENRNCPIENIQTEIKIPKYNLNSLENESTIFLYQKRLDEKLVETEFDNTEDQYHYIVNKLHEAAKEALGETEETHTNHPLYYWNEEIKKEVKLKKEKYLKWLNTRNLQDKIELNAQQAKIRKKVAEAKNKVWEQSCQKIESYIGGKRNTEAWKTIKNLRRNSKETTHIKYITHDSWEKYFKSLLTENREEYLGNPEYNEMIDLQAENYIHLEIETEESVSITSADGLLKDPTISNDTAYVKSHCAFLIPIIKGLEFPAKQVYRKLRLIEEVTEKINLLLGSIGTKVSEKLKTALQTNPGLTTLCTVADILSDKSTEHECAVPLHLIP
ncbi:uncharacterized protein LOC126175324 [Schistocerca cancellata]|uniref:uncharacterized protein LOC126175324 n=1 Tax=Schistocerca cancellata TaxID=274614 RepID=UPI0021179F28|nr:uncharacterized protein LOC126175324 [Schistocerca cancellata]